VRSPFQIGITIYQFRQRRVNFNPFFPFRAFEPRRVAGFSDLPAILNEPSRRAIGVELHSGLLVLGSERQHAQPDLLFGKLALDRKTG